MNKILSGYAQGNYYSADVNMDERLKYLSSNRHYYYVLGQQDDLLATYRLPDGSIMSHPLESSAEAAFMIMEVDTDRVYGVQPLGMSMSQIEPSYKKHPDFYMGKLIDTYESMDENMLSDTIKYRVIGALYSDDMGTDYAYDRLEMIEYEHRVESSEGNERLAQRWLLENHAEHWFGAAIIPVKENSIPYNNPIPEYYEALYGTRDRNEILMNIARELHVDTIGYSDGKKVEVSVIPQPFHTVSYMESGSMDSAPTSTLFEVGGSYNIQSPDDVIARELLHMMADMRMETRDGAGNVIGVETLTNIPEYWDIQQAVAAGEDLIVQGDLINPEQPDWGSAIEFRYDGKTREVTRSFSAGQFEYYGKFGVKEIEPENVRFIPVENFSAPYSGIDTVQRFYTEPFVSESSARKAMGAMRLHDIPDTRTSKSMVVADIKELENNNWYKDNMACVEMINASEGALSWDKGFDVWASTHRANLTMAAPDDMFIPSTASIPVTNRNVLAVSHAMEDYVRWSEDRVQNVSPSEDPQIEDAMKRAFDTAKAERDYYRDGILPSAKFDMSQIPINGYVEMGSGQTGPKSIRSHASTSIAMPGFNTWLQKSGNLAAVKIGCYGLTKEDMKSSYYDKQDYYQGIVNINSTEKLVTFKRIINGRAMTDAECEQACKREPVKLENIPKMSGGTYTGYGALIPKSFESRGKTINYWGIDISFNAADASAKLSKSEDLKTKSEQKQAHAKATDGEKTSTKDKSSAEFFTNKYGTKYCTGEWQGKAIKFKPMFKNEAVSEADCKKLLAGEPVTLVRADALGIKFQSSCELQNMTYKDRKTGKPVSYIGIKEIERADMSGKSIPIPNRGHEFDGTVSSSSSQYSGPSFG